MAKRDDHRHGRVKKRISRNSSRKWAPLNTGFMLTSIIGFFISALYVTQRFSLKVGIAFSVVFFCMFLASIISMGRASPDAQLAARPIR